MQEAELREKERQLEQEKIRQRRQLEGDLDDDEELIAKRREALRKRLLESERANNQAQQDGKRIYE